MKISRTIMNYPKNHGWSTYPPKRIPTPERRPAMNKNHTINHNSQRGKSKSQRFFVLEHDFLGGGFKYSLNFHPYLGKISNLTDIFQRGWNHQLAFFWSCSISPLLRFFVKAKNISRWNFFWPFSDVRIFALVCHHRCQLWTRIHGGESLGSQAVVVKGHFLGDLVLAVFVWFGGRWGNDRSHVKVVRMIIVNLEVGTCWYFFFRDKA